jgi:acyl carrier protein phosphodiesterase
MCTLFKWKYENLKSYENLEDVIRYFEEVLDIAEEIETPSEEQLTEIEETFQELSDQYWHNYPKKISGKFKTRLEAYINKYFVSA